MNSHAVISRGAQKMVVAGVIDFWASRSGSPDKSDPQAAVANVPDSKIKILLAHQPQTALSTTGLDLQLQLSGHTHGGQFIRGLFWWDFFIIYARVASTREHVGLRESGHGILGTAGAPGVAL